MGKDLKFTPPQGAVPEDKKSGDTFDAVCTYRVEQNGEICLIKLGDTDMDYDEKSDKSYVRPDMSDEVEAMQKSMLADGANSQAM